MSRSSLFRDMRSLIKKNKKEGHIPVIGGEGHRWCVSAQMKLAAQPPTKSMPMVEVTPLNGSPRQFTIWTLAGKLKLAGTCQDLA